MESQMFDIVKVDKENVIARFNCLRRIAKLWQFLEVLLLLGLISWSSTRAPAALRTAGACLVQFSTFLFNHHVVFLIGNAIIVLLFLLCRQNDAAGGDIYSDYVKHSEATADPTDLPTPYIGDEEKQIVVCKEEIVGDEVAAAIEKATRQIKRFQRTQSEKLKRENRAPPVRRSASQNRRRTVIPGEIERLSSEEFRRTVDEFIHKHWCKKKDDSQSRNNW